MITISICFIIVIIIVIFAIHVSSTEKDSGCGVWLLAIVFIIFCIALILCEI